MGSVTKGRHRPTRRRDDGGGEFVDTTGFRCGGLDRSALDAARRDVGSVSFAEFGDRASARD